MIQVYLLGKMYGLRWLSDTAKQMGWEVDFAVPLLVETGIGDNWDEAH